MLAQGKSKLSLAQFIIPKDGGALKEYFHQTALAVKNEKGSRDHHLAIDQAITAGEFPHQYLVVDRFPSSQALLLAHEKTREIRLAALQEVYAILVKPDPVTTRITKTLGVIRPILSRLVNTDQIKELDGMADQLDPETDPDLNQILKFKDSDLGHPFYMINMNQFNPDGKKVYKQYSLQITPYLISVGGYPVIFGDILGTYIGDEKSRLFNNWHEFGLVYYPSRANFLRMMTNTPHHAAETRRAGLIRALLMACS
jgi:hypothetical protein